MSVSDDYHCQLISELNVSAFFRIFSEDLRYKHFCSFVEKCKKNSLVEQLQKDIIKVTCSNMNILLRKTQLDKQPPERVYSLVYDGVKLLYPEFDLSILIQAANVKEPEDCEPLIYYSFGNPIVERFLKEHHEIVLLESYEGIVEEEICKISDDMLLDPKGKKALKQLEEKLRSIEDLNPDDLEKELLLHIKGQEGPIKKIVNKMLPLIAGIRGFTSIFGVGPTGVGKTYMATCLSKALFGEDKLVLVDCAQFKGAHEVAKLIGGTVGYIGYDETPFLTRHANKGNNWVFLFDEFEKAHPDFQDALLNLIDTGMVMDNKGRLLDFSKSVFFLTSNIGTSEVLRENVGFGAIETSMDQQEQQFIEQVKKKLKPEFSNRLREIIVFNKLSKESIRDIVILKLKDYRIENTDTLIAHVLELVDYKLYGARDVDKKIEQHIEPAYARKLISMRPGERKKSILSPRFNDGEISFVRKRKTK